MTNAVPDDNADARGDAAPPIAAGRSAREVAQGAQAAAQALERKAAYARRRVANFRQGALGEASTADALAELTPDGWVVLHDRLAPAGGNIDHLLVGPGGVVVVDSKNWSGAVVVNSDGLRVGGRNRSAEVARVATLAEAVRQSLAEADLHPPVHAVVSLTQEAPPDGPVRLIAGPLVAGVADVPWSIKALRTLVRPSQVDALVARALQAFPAADRTLDEALEARSPKPRAVGDLFSRANIFLYVEPWARSGRRRLYLKDVEGNALGYKDLVSGEVSISVSDQATVVRGVLANAHAGGLALRRSELPKIPVQLPGGRLLGHLGKLWSNFLIGHHWRRGGKDRLYVTHAVIEQGIFELGYIDLASGLLFPSSDEPLGKDLREPRRYLERVVERYPRR